MANILLTGITTLDIINSIDHCPDENMEIRALEHGKNFHCPAFNADTLAAGDSYNALQQSCALAARKCSQQGIDNRVI